MIILAVALFAGAAAFFRQLDGMGFSSERIGMVYLEGVILDSTSVVDWIQTLRDDETVKGVILRVNSPGGAIAPSQEIYQAVRKLAEIKPVVASYAVVAASGGYYSSAPSTKIVANPGSITASIGVVAEFMTFGEALEKLGVRPEVLTTGKYKGAGTPLRDLTDDQRAQMLEMMHDMHEQFVDDVASARKLDRAKVAAIADGRALTGRQALEVGLVDRLGTEEDAVALLKELAGIQGRVPLLEGPEVKETLLDRILGKLGVAPTGSGWHILYK